MIRNTCDLSMFCGIYDHVDRFDRSPAVFVPAKYHAFAMMKVCEAHSTMYRKGSKPRGGNPSPSLTSIRPFVVKGKKICSYMAPRKKRSHNSRGDSEGN